MAFASFFVCVEFPSNPYPSNFLLFFLFFFLKNTCPRCSSRHSYHLYFIPENPYIYVYILPTLLYLYLHYINLLLNIHIFLVVFLYSIQSIHVFVCTYLLILLYFISLELCLLNLHVFCSCIFLLVLYGLYFYYFVKFPVLAAAPDNISFIIFYYTIFVIYVLMFSLSLSYKLLTIIYTTIINFKIKNFPYYILF